MIHVARKNKSYGVATISTLLRIIRLFCRISSLLYGSFTKQTYHFKEPTNCSHPIAYVCGSLVTHVSVCCSGSSLCCSVSSVCCSVSHVTHISVT